jgi:phage-related protein
VECVGRSIPVEFFRTDAGNEPVVDWLRARCSRPERAIVGADLRLVQDHWPVGLPIRSLGGGLYEVRSDLENRSARLLFCFKYGRIIVLHAFFKTSQKTPKAELDLARSRMRTL